MTKQTNTKMRKSAEFKAFIETIKAGQISHWATIAEVLGVDKTTIIVWKRMPEAQEAIKQGIDYALAQMEQAGKKDWRMWESKLKMLGVNPANKFEGKVATINITDRILKEFGLSNDDGQNQEAENDTPQD